MKFVIPLDELTMNTKIFAILATILMLGTLAMPVAAQKNDEKTYEIEELLYDLETAVTDHNEAVAEGYPEDAANYKKDILNIQAELLELGVEVEVVIENPIKIIPRFPIPFPSGAVRIFLPPWGSGGVETVVA